MSDQTRMICEMVDILPDSEQTLAVEFIKRMILAWDPDYTNLTEQERIRMEQAEESGFIDEEDINWDNLEQYL